MPASASPVAPRVHLAELLSGLEAVADLRQEHDAHRGIDRVALLLPAGAEVAARAPEPSASTAASVPARSATIGLGPGRGREHLSGSSTTRGSPPCAWTIAAERLERLTRVERRGRPCPPLPHRDPEQPGDRLAGEHHRRVAQTAVQLASEQPDRLDDVERVADRLAQRLGHVRHRGSRRSPPVLGERRARLGELGRVLGRLHERAAPAFTSSRTRSVPIASFFDITLAAMSGIDGTVAVASRSA